MTYSLDFREKVLKTREKDNLSMKETAIRFGIGVMTILRWTKRIEPKRTRYRPALKLDMEGLKRDVIMYPDAYLIERAKGVSRNAIWHGLKRLNVTYKKNSTTSKNGSRKKICILQ
jgi:transposase